MIRKTYIPSQRSKVILDTEPQFGECPFCEVVDLGFRALCRCTLNSPDAECDCVEKYDAETFDFSKCKFCTTLGNALQGNFTTTTSQTNDMVPNDLILLKNIK